MSLENTDKKQGHLFNQLKNKGKVKIPVSKMLFLNNVGLFLNTREKVLNNFNRAGRKPTPEQTPELAPKSAPEPALSSSKLHREI